MHGWTLWSKKSKLEGKRLWTWPRGGEGGSLLLLLLSSEDPNFLEPLSGLMKLLRSKGAREGGVGEVAPSVAVVLELSLGARGRNRLHPSVREGSCSHNPRVN